MPDRAAQAEGQSCEHVSVPLPVHPWLASPPSARLTPGPLHPRWPGRATPEP